MAGSWQVYSLYPRRSTLGIRMLNGKTREESSHFLTATGLINTRHQYAGCNSSRDDKKRNEESLQTILFWKHWQWTLHWKKLPSISRSTVRQPLISCTGNLCLEPGASNTANASTIGWHSCLSLQSSVISVACMIAHHKVASFWEWATRVCNGASSMKAQVWNRWFTTKHNCTSKRPKQRSPPNCDCGRDKKALTVHWYQELNKVLMRKGYYMPTLEETAPWLDRAKFFSMLDAAFGFSANQARHTQLLPQYVCNATWKVQVYSYFLWYIIYSQCISEKNLHAVWRSQQYWDREVLEIE